MDASALLGLLEQAVPGAVFEPAHSIDLQTTVYVPGDRVVEIARALRERPELRFEFLAEVTAVHHGDTDRTLVYQNRSYARLQPL